MDLHLEPQLLRDAGRRLRHHAQAVSEGYDVPVPDTGDSRQLTRAGLEEVVAAGAALVERFGELGDDVVTFLQRAEEADRGVATALGGGGR